MRRTHNGSHAHRDHSDAVGARDGSTLSPETTAGSGSGKSMTNLSSTSRRTHRSHASAARSTASAWASTSKRHLHLPTIRRDIDYSPHEDGQISPTSPNPPTRHVANDEVSSFWREDDEDQDFLDRPGSNDSSLRPTSRRSNIAADDRDEASWEAEHCLSHAHSNSASASTTTVRDGRHSESPNSTSSKRHRASRFLHLSTSHPPHEDRSYRAGSISQLSPSSPGSATSHTMASGPMNDYLTAKSSGNPVEQPWDRRSSVPRADPYVIVSNDPEDPANRRPSIASISTVSSNESNRSRTQAIQKKLQGFFGENPPPEQILQTPQPANERPEFGRQNSHQSTDGKTGSDAEPSRPRTPQPSSEVTPWLFQDPEDIKYGGDAPVRNSIQLHPRDRRETVTAASSSKSTTSHRMHISNRLRYYDGTNRHMTDFNPPVTGNNHASLSTRTETFPAFNRSTSTLPPKITHAGPINPRQNSSISLATQLDGPSESRLSAKSDASGANGSSSGGKRSLFDRIRNRHHKGDPLSASRELPRGSVASPFNGQLYPPPKSVSDPTNPGSSDDPSYFPISSNRTPLSRAQIQQLQAQQQANQAAQGSKKDHHHRLPFISKRGYTQTEGFTAKDPNQAGPEVTANDALFNLDTDLEHMEGIVSNKPAILTTPRGPGGQPIWPYEEAAPDIFTKDSNGKWEVPESWIVKPAGGDAIGKLREIDENGVPRKDDEPGVPYFIRIFRPDGTFATLQVPLNTTAAEIVGILDKKTFSSDDLTNCHIILRKHDVSRQLDAGERPVLIQQKLLEQAGYTIADHIPEIGIDDHTYLCKFTFYPANMLGFSSYERDPGFNKVQKFTNVDLRGRNLITIPIALHQRSSEIVYLDLSKNISLDIPKDFIQGCSSLRQIQYTSNEAWRIPQSFSAASKLMLLNLSNNILESLEHADLHKLESLAKLELANNKLSALPLTFSQFSSLRTLNLSSNSLSELPDCICEIKTLIELDISFNNILTIPGIGKLINLERLWCTNNKLSGSPQDTVSDLHNLREIDCRFNSIMNLDNLALLPQLEIMYAGHNSITTFEGSFAKLRTLFLDHNPITKFSLGNQVPTLTTLSLASANLAALPEELWARCSNLTRLTLSKNHLANLSPQIGKLLKLEYLSVAKNSMHTLPSEIGRLLELRFLDVRENNISKLPSELWFCRRLETLNISSNVLEQFPKAPTQASISSMEQSFGGSGNIAPTSPILEESPTGEGERRGSQTPSYLSSGSTPPSATPYRKGSMASSYGYNSRKPSMLPRTPTDSTLTSISPVSRKDSMNVNRVNATMIGSLRNLLLADNRLSDDIFDEITALQELRVVNISYNELIEIPHRSIRRWTNLTELYLSGNELTSLPTEDLEDITGLRVLHLNSNRFQVLPAELGKARQLTVLDAGSNFLKYNVANWPYDWNWNCNPQLKYLNLSGNKRLEIKPANTWSATRNEQNLTDFGSLTNLRVLGLMDVTLMIPSVPDQSDDRRVRTSGSQVGTMPYGIADTLGKSDHLSTVDLVVPRLAHDDEVLVGMFDGQQLSNSGSRIAKYLQENFRAAFEEQLGKASSEDTPVDMLRRTYLALNKELATMANQSRDMNERRSAHRPSVVSTQAISKEDVNSGCVATVMFIQGKDLYVSNVGDAEAVLISSGGGFRRITEKHDPAEAKERARIRDAGGFVSKQGKLNDELTVSRAFGYIHMTPALIAAPFVQKISIQESDEMILLASRELWDYLTPDYAVDIARSERDDLMRAAQKLRDLAIAFGACSKISVMCLGVNDWLRRREKAKWRSPSMSMGPSGLPDEYVGFRKPKRPRDATLDSKLNRLKQEVEAPVGDVSLVFTDIKNSTMIWETYQTAMQSAIKMHNDVMRRQLRLIGGYEVKTEGDAFMVAFPTVTSALLWCFTIQTQLLEVEWPQEILSSVNGQEVSDDDGNVLFRGLSVRMGIHWGQPVCEPDPITRRMDYFGPMVNRAARISAVADGGQITVSSDFIAEVQRSLETYLETDRSNSNGSEEMMEEDAQSAVVRQELRSLSHHGFEVKDLGEKRLKGLENPEHIYLMYPHALSGRLSLQQQRIEMEKINGSVGPTKEPHSRLTVELDNIWDLWRISLRLEMLCSTLESRHPAELKPPETALLERTKERGGEVTDRFLVNFVEHQVSRIETCITSLAVRNLVRPFSTGRISAIAGPMSDVLTELTGQLQELRDLKAQFDFEMAPS